MERETFYERFIAGMAANHFHFEISARNYSGVANEQNSDKIIMAGLNIATALFGGVNMGSASIKENRLKSDVATFHELTPYIFYKIQLAQPFICTLVDADTLSKDDCIRIAKRFDELVMPLRKYAGGTFLNKFGVYGVLFFSFFDSNKRRELENTIKSDCRKSHFFKKSYIVSWAVDANDKKIITHNGIPIFTGMVLSKDKIERALRGV